MELEFLNELHDNALAIAPDLSDVPLNVIMHPSSLPTPPVTAYATHAALTTAGVTSLRSQLHRRLDFIIFSPRDCATTSALDASPCWRRQSFHYHSQHRTDVPLAQTPRDQRDCPSVGSSTRNGSE